MNGMPLFKEKMYPVHRVQRKILKGTIFLNRTSRIRVEFMGFGFSAVPPTVEIQPIYVAEEPRNLSLFLWLVFTMLYEISYIKKK